MNVTPGGYPEMCHLAEYTLSGILFPRCLEAALSWATSISQNGLNLLCVHLPVLLHYQVTKKRLRWSRELG